jgi:hypothetical protein
VLAACLARGSGAFRHLYQIGDFRIPGHEAADIVTY